MDETPQKSTPNTPRFTEEELIFMTHQTDMLIMCMLAAMQNMQIPAADYESIGADSEYTQFEEDGEIIDTINQGVQTVYLHDNNVEETHAGNMETHEADGETENQDIEVGTEVGETIDTISQGVEAMDGGIEIDGVNVETHDGNVEIGTEVYNESNSECSSEHN